LPDKRFGLAVSVHSSSKLNGTNVKSYSRAWDGKPIRKKAEEQEAMEAEEELRIRRKIKEIIARLR
jgi:hypothetical protein